MYKDHSYHGQYSFANQRKNKARRNRGQHELRGEKILGVLVLEKNRFINVNSMRFLHKILYSPILEVTFPTDAKKRGCQVKVSSCWLRLVRLYGPTEALLLMFAGDAILFFVDST